MKKRAIPDQDYGEFISKTLSSITDMEILILKGHILIENSLFKFVTDCSRQKNIEISNLKFFQLIVLAKSLGLFTNNDDYLESQINNINTLRNQMAHTLEYDEIIIENLINAFLNSPKYSHIFKQGNSQISNFSKVICSICGEIIGRKLARQKIDEYSKILLAKEIRKDPQKFEVEIKNHLESIHKK
jgi:hypothetical protein